MNDNNDKNDNKDFISPYSSDTEADMQHFYFSLSEKDKRHYAAVEAIKLAHGGIQYIAQLFNCSRQTVSSGIEELKKKLSKN
jgi:hypothetical protein